MFHTFGLKDNVSGCPGLVGSIHDFLNTRKNKCSICGQVWVQPYGSKG